MRWAKSGEHVYLAGKVSSSLVGSVYQLGELRARPFIFVEVSLSHRCDLMRDRNVCSVLNSSALFWLIPDVV